MITSLQNDKVKLAHALQTQAKARRKEDKIVLEGVRLVRDALAAGQTPDFILYDPDTFDAADLPDALAVTPEIMRHISATETPQGVVAVFPTPSPVPLAPVERVLILDAIRDPGNLGTILRTAAAGDAQVVLLAPGSVDPYNPKVLRSAMGAHFRVPVLEASWTRILLYCRDLLVYLADGDGETLYDAVDWGRPWALIIGSEADGAGAEARQMAGTHIRIPMAAGAESLNAAVAAGVILFEAARQRRMAV